MSGRPFGARGFYLHIDRNNERTNVRICLLEARSLVGILFESQVTLQTD